MWSVNPFRRNYYAASSSGKEVKPYTPIPQNPDDQPPEDQPTDSGTVGPDSRSAYGDQLGNLFGSYTDILKPKLPSWSMPWSGGGGGSGGGGSSDGPSWYSQEVQNVLDKYPNYNGVWNKNGRMNSKFAVGMPSSMGALWNTVYSEGGPNGVELNTSSTPWASAAMAQQDVNESTARDRAMADLGASRGSAESALAMRGGLSSGARERLARSGLENQAGIMQDINRTGMGQRADITTRDIGYKQGLSGDLANQELGIEKMNTQTGLQDLYNQNAWGMDKAKLEMGALASGYTADALRNNGGAGGDGGPFGSSFSDPANWVDPVGKLASNVGVPQWGQAVLNPVGWGNRQVVNTVTGKKNSWNPWG